jgi:hypothetical protein
MSFSDFWLILFGLLVLALGLFFMLKATQVCTLIVFSFGSLLGKLGQPGKKFGITLST